ncbi:hypothetical protein GA0070616_2333 [Micromonospora nigra]|uniref:Uncharacterized protein n=1 Tax=Micromonospora nigra TaxID=145857 RepID=A0A1C6RWR0_9ACTN|nr:hypothetical protein [Micromonospora nigra]SCL21574.1 hypothetical protein GA0070616_2333 [Micromonospora nigra]
MGDEWLVDENIDVDIQQLKDFATAIQNELTTNFTPSLQNGILPVINVQAPFGGGGLKEGAFFRGRHDESRMAISQLLSDAAKGLGALSLAAMGISAEYLTGDALSQATIGDVLDAFTVVDGQETLHGSSQQGADPNDPIVAVPEAATDPATYFGEDDSATDDDREETPEVDQEQVIAEDTVGEMTIQADSEGMSDSELEFDQSDLVS